MTNQQNGHETLHEHSSALFDAFAEAAKKPGVNIQAFFETLTNPPKKEPHPHQYADDRNKKNR